jgi:hypothetical protein
VTYRTGNHWGVTIVREPTRCCDLHTRHCEAPADLCCHSCTEAAHTGLTPHADGSRCVLDPDDSQLVAVVVNGDQALATRICALLNGYERQVRMVEHGRTLIGDAPSSPLSAPVAAQEPLVGGSGRPEGVETISGRFRIEVVALFGDRAETLISCTRCAWGAQIDGALDLAELNRRAGEHTEVCR